MSPDLAYAAYKDFQARFDAAGIPWNKKGSPHGLRLKALGYLRQVPFSHIVSMTLRDRTAEFAANVKARYEGSGA